MKECSICYEKKISFFPLDCCQGYHMCIGCSEKLVKPSCPFCRETIFNLTHLSDTSLIDIYESLLLQSSHQRQLESRWFRKHLRRIEKLRQRDELAHKNRASTREQNKRHQRKHRKQFFRDILYEIKEVM